MAKVASGKSETVHKIPLACADETTAIEFMESVRWGEEPSCPHCGAFEVYKMLQRGSEARNERFLWRCRACGKQYTVRIGTVMEDSPIPVRHWVFAFWAASASKKGVSSLQIRRQTGVSYKSALFMMHRIRWAMNHAGSHTRLTGHVEVDSTYVGGKHQRYRTEASPEYQKYSDKKYKGGPRPDFAERKTEVVALVSRDGSARAFVRTTVQGKNLRRAIREMVDPSATIHTDQHRAFKSVGKDFEGRHHSVNHSMKEYVRHDGPVMATTNTVEAFFALLKRGVIGTFHNVSKKHLHRYCSEFEFRWNTRDLDDGGRLVALIHGGEGARLKYAEQVG